MKKPLDSKTTAVILAGVALVLIVAGLAYFKPQIGAGPPVVPIPYKKPGSAGYGPGSAPGAPMGAPRTG